MRRSVDDVRNLPLDTPGGGHVRLGDVATITVAPTPNTIERESESRLIQVGANVSGRDLSSVVDDIKARVAKVSLPAAATTRRSAARRPSSRPPSRTWASSASPRCSSSSCSCSRCSRARGSRR